MAVSFALFDTLVDARYDAPAADRVAAELRARDVRVPDDWTAAYRETHIDLPEGAAAPLPAHVARALASRGVDAPHNAARRAAVAAFDPEVTLRPGAREAVDAAREAGPVAVCSNTTVPELARRVLIRADLRDAFDAVVTGLSCGWRKPAPQMFERVAAALDSPPESLVHVGSDPATDGGLEALGGTYVDIAEVPLTAFPAWLEGR
ncbi:HAD family hydrolase [Natronomonas sp. EA1]|uniref:HAD family hydrolase n=1 Tax=Natronomonas sp. EA1 TaxID=3421655 RepID=UPI003EBE51C4